VSGYAAADPAMTLMKSRRRICLPQGLDYAHDGLITAAFYDRRNGVQAGHHLDAADVRFGSKADIPLILPDVRFTPESGHGLAQL
jgi:hypothetical protein